MDKKNKKSLLTFQINIGGTGIAAKAVFAKNMAVMIKSGLSIVEALEIAADSSSGKFREIIINLKKTILGGGSLASGLKLYPKVFSGLFTNAIEAAEASGTLEENLEYIAQQLRKEKDLVAKIRGAMLYPTVVLVATFVLGLAMAFFVLPKIMPLFEGMGVDLPFTTRMLVAFSHLVEKNGFNLMFGILLAFIFLIWLVRQKFMHPLNSWVALHIPIIKSLVRNANVARFCRTLGTLIKGGLSIDDALRISSETSGNYFYRQALIDISRRLSAGSMLSKNLMSYEYLFPKLVSRMIKVGEQSGKMEETLFYLADYFENEVDTDSSTLSSTIEPLLLILVGLVVGFLALSIITPIYNITSNVGR